MLVGVLVGLNAAAFVQKEKTPDSETKPNRSTFNSGATGTQAFYTLLAEGGRKVSRWRDSPAELLSTKDGPGVFVVIGSLRQEFKAKESDDLLQWVANGSRLVLIDREPPQGLVTTTANWKLSIRDDETEAIFSVDPSEPKQMTGSTAAVKPVQPSTFTNSINAVQPSKFASAIEFERLGGEAAASPEPDEFDKDLPPLLKPDMNGRGRIEMPSSKAPVVHFTSAGKNLVVDVPYGEGQIVILSDPFIVSNTGISLADNAQLAMDLVSFDGRPIAFDEFHQGFGNDSNRFLQFFEGTPVAAIFLQCLVIAGLAFYSQSRRFARPVPVPEPDRLSKLEYVAAMAELQGRTKAYDLAIENIYSDFRRRACRSLGLDNMTAKYSDIARLLAERTGIDADTASGDFFRCEEIIRGEATNQRETLRLIETLRNIEAAAGLNRSSKTRV